MGRARRFVRDVLADWGVEEEFEELATLLTSELVTNAILHARSAPEVTVRLVDRHLRIGVSDDNPRTPVAKHYGPTAGTGRGMILVESMASSWGSDDSGAGKVVWFELGPDDGHAGRGPLQAEAAPVADDFGAGPGQGRFARRRRGPGSRAEASRPGRVPSRPHAPETQRSSR